MGKMRGVVNKTGCGRFVVGLRPMDHGTSEVCLSSQRIWTVATTNCGALWLSVLTTAGPSLASHTLHTRPFLSLSLVKVTVPAEEASQEVKQAKFDATINAGGVMK